MSCAKYVIKISLNYLNCLISSYLHTRIRKNILLLIFITLFHPPGSWISEIADICFKSFFKVDFSLLWISLSYLNLTVAEIWQNVLNLPTPTLTPLDDEFIHNHFLMDIYFMFRIYTREITRLCQKYYTNFKFKLQEITVKYL